MQAYQGRTRFITVPVMAEVGLQKRAKDGQPGWYVGWFGRVPLDGTLGREHVGVEFRLWTGEELPELGGDRTGCASGAPQ